MDYSLKVTVADGVFGALVVEGKTLNLSEKRDPFGDWFSLFWHCVRKLS